MKNNRAYFGAAFGIVFVLYTVTVFTFADKSLPAFWTAYIFTVIAFALQIPAFYLSYQRKAGLKDVFYGMSLTVISLIYLVIQILASFIFIFLFSVSPKVANVVQFIFLSIYLILGIFTLLGRKVVMGTDNTTTEKIVFLQLLEDDIIAAKQSTNDPAIQTRLNELQELARYSDPMSHPSLVLVEQKIANKIATMIDAVKSDDLSTIGTLCDEVEQMLGERNRKCKILKSR